MSAGESNVVLDLVNGVLVFLGGKAFIIDSLGECIDRSERSVRSVVEGKSSSAEAVVVDE